MCKIGSFVLEEASPKKVGAVKCERRDFGGIPRRDHGLMAAECVVLSVVSANT